MADNPFEGLTLESLPRSPSPLSSATSTPFPCLADELEEQVKALERDLNLAASSGPSGLSQEAPSARLLSPERDANAEDIDEYELVKGLSLHDDAPQTSLQGTFAAEIATPTAVAARGSASRQPVMNHVSNTEASIATKGLVVQHSGQRGAPLAVAVHNADCVRRGLHSPWPGAWNGCCISPWCSRVKRHPGACNARAAVPGLAAYLPEELAALGLPALPEIVGPLPPAAALAANNAAIIAIDPLTSTEDAHDLNSGCGQGHQRGNIVRLGPFPESNHLVSTSTVDVSHLLISGKRKAHDHIGDHVMVPTSAPSTPSESLTLSDNHSNNADEAEHSNRFGTSKSRRATKLGARKRTRAGTTTAALKSALLVTGSSEGGSLNADDGATTSEEHRSSLTEEMKLSLGAPVVTSRSKGRIRATRGSRVGSRAVGAPTSAKTSSKGGSGNRGHGQRRGPQVWISGQTVDPRTGETVTEVPPATFCSQCRATSTPVWRAGPFGHKTLCNACGVRWMKIKPGRKV